jgi:hypothetical protein
MATIGDHLFALLDANEQTWEFVAVDRVGRVGRVKNLLVRELAALASIGR